MNNIAAMVVGLGRVGWQYDRDRGIGSSHLAAYLLHPKVRSVVAVDSDQSRFDPVLKWLDDANVKKEVIFESDYVEAIKKWKPQLASVCTPTPTHCEIMRNICHPNGPDVICLEKPVASSIDEANMIANRAAYVYGLEKERTGIGKPRVAVNLSRRWHPNWRAVKDLLDKGAIGKPVLALGEHPGPLLRSGIHMLDLFNWYFGPCEMARSHAIADSWMTRKMPETDDVAISGEFHHERGARSILLSAELADTDYQLFELQIYGEKGALEVRHNGELVVVRDLVDRLCYGGLLGLTEGLVTRPVVTETSMRGMVGDLVDCLDDPAREPRCTLDDGLQAQIMVHLLRQSHFNLIDPNELDWKEAVRSH